MALYKVERIYFVEANDDIDAVRKAREQDIPNRLTIALATEQEAQELAEANAVAAAHGEEGED